MTQIHFEWEKVDGSPASGFIIVTPFRRTIQGDAIVLTSTVTYRINGTLTIELPPTDADNAYQVINKPTGEKEWIDFISVPDATEVQYVDLPKVDPRTLPTFE